jgi:hypothetical protein
MILTMGKSMWWIGARVHISPQRTPPASDPGRARIGSINALDDILGG